MKTGRVTLLGIFTWCAACSGSTNDNTDDACRDGGMIVAYDDSQWIISAEAPGTVTVDFESSNIFWTNCHEKIRIYRLVDGQQVEFQDDLHDNTGWYDGVYLDGEYLCPGGVCDDVPCGNNEGAPAMRISAVEFIRTGSGTPPEDAEACHSPGVPTAVETYESRAFSGSVLVEVDVFVERGCSESEQITCSAELGIP